MHRDLSVGNLYLYKGRGLIGDFEYAKLRNSDIENEESTVNLSCFFLVLYSFYVYIGYA